MALDIMRQMPEDPDKIPGLKYTLPTVTVSAAAKKPSWIIDSATKNINQNTGEATYGWNPGKDVYTLRRTVTPHKTEEDIKKYTQIPSSVRDIDFIHNMHLNDSDVNDFNILDAKINTPFNVPRFLFEPHVDKYRDEARGLIPKGTEQSKEQYRNNMLSDVYKYYLLRNKGNRESAWNDAQNFTKKEIDPLLEGSVYNQRFSSNKPDYIAPGSPLLTSIVNDDYLNNLVDAKLTRKFNPELLSEVEKRKQMPESEIKNYAIDWLTKYKKMQPEQAEMYYKTLENNAKKRYEENYPKYKESSKKNYLKIMKGAKAGEEL